MTIRFPTNAAPSTQCTQPTRGAQPTAQPAGPSAWAMERQQFSQVAATLLQHFGEAGGGSFFGSGTIDMNDLYAAANGQKGGPEVQQAAAWLLQRPQLVRELETRGSANPDGKISAKDLQLELGSLSREQQVESLRYDPRLGAFQQSLSTVQSAFSTFDSAKRKLFGNSPDGKISRDDLNEVLTGNYPQQLREAAFFLTSNPDLMSMLDTGAKGGKADGTISINDVQSLLGQVSNVRATMPAQPQYSAQPRW